MAHEGAVQGFIAVAFGRGYPVAVAVLPLAVKAPEDGVNVEGQCTFLVEGNVSGFIDDADCVQVVNLFEGYLLGAHLEPDGVGRLDALPDFEFEVGPFQGSLDGGDETVDFPVAEGDVPADALGDFVVCVGLLVPQPDVLHFGLYSVKAKPVGQGNEDEHCLGENLVTLVLGHEFDGPAVVKAVGELYQSHPHVVVEGEQYALEILGLVAFDVRTALTVLVVEYGLDLGKPVHQGGDFVSELRPEVFDGIRRVFHDIVQEGCGDAFVTEPYFAYNDLRDLYRMDDVWLPGTAADVPVGAVGEIERLPDHLKFLFRVAAASGHLLKRKPFLPDEGVIFYGELRETHLSDSHSGM